MLVGCYKIDNKIVCKPIWKIAKEKNENKKTKPTYILETKSIKPVKPVVCHNVSLYRLYPKMLFKRLFHRRVFVPSMSIKKLKPRAYWEKICLRLGFVPASECKK